MKNIFLSKETNEIQKVIALRKSRHKRYSDKEFVLEGRVQIDAAVNNGWKVKSLYFNHNISLSRWAVNYLSSHKVTAKYGVTDLLMEKMTDKTDRPELIAIAEAQFRFFSDYSFLEREVIVLVDQPKSPGNLGMIIRSAAVFGANAVVISGHAADEYDPQCIRASVGTFFALPVYRIEGVNSFIKKINLLKSKKNVSILSTSDKGDEKLDKVNLQSDILFLILGNESLGISRGYKQIASNFIRIPTVEKFSSLNIGAAASIFLYEIFQARQLN